MMYSGVLQSNICFALGRKSKKKRSKNDQNIMKSAPNSVKNRPGDLLEALWRLLGCPRGPRLNFGSEKLVRWTPPWTPRWGPFFDFFSMQNSSDFLLVFWMHFGRILHPFWRPKCIQNGVRNGKRVFLILSVSCRRELNLGGFGTPKSIKMTSENRLEN